MADTKALDLFQAYNEGKLPEDDGGYIVSSFFDANSTYSIYEIVAYDNVKSIYADENGLTFQADGHKLFVLVEPIGYAHKYQEPFTRGRKSRFPTGLMNLTL